MEGLMLTQHSPINNGGKRELPLLTEIPNPGSTYSSSQPSGPALAATNQPALPASLVSASEILDALRNSPSQETVSQSLHLLDTTFDIRRPSGLSSQFTKVLLEITLPDFWHVLSKKERVLLAKCLTSPAGLGGMTARLKALTPLASGGDGGEAQTCRENLGNVLALLQIVLGRKGFVYEILTLSEGESEIKRHILWRELVALVAGGRLLSVAAEAELALGRFSKGQNQRWVSNGKMFALWLGKEIARASLDADIMADASWKALAMLLTGSFRLGYTDNVVEGLTYKLIDPKDESHRLQKLIGLLPMHDKRSYIIALLRVISVDLQITYDEDGGTWWKQDATKVSGVAALLEKFILHDDDFRTLMLEWLTSTTGGGVGDPLALRRAIMAVVAKDELAFRGLFEKLLQQFADKLWINHTPIMRQEVNVQILLLCAGISHRQSPTFLSRLTKSSSFLSGVSNRLAASSHRARFLGMIVGESFSALANKDTKMQMSFETEETESDEAKRWKDIPKIEDYVGSLKDLFATITALVPKKRKASQRSLPPPPAGTSPIIQVVEGDCDTDSDEFTPYALPDSDPEDGEDEDATTIDRNKPLPPVYIRTLLTYFHATENYDRQQLALLHAAPLIRRKAASGGKEISSHLEELAAALAGIDDRFDMPDFSELRSAGLVALVVAEPIRMGQWLARQFFIGDYGLSQRATLLVAIGLGARELAGLEEEPQHQRKKLPLKLDTVWSSSSKDPIASITRSLKSTYLAPLAASAADVATGPNILKVRTFSSRMAVEARRAPPTHRKILVLVGSAFFFPLTGGWLVTSRDTPNPPHADPHILVLFLNTLSVLFHAGGPGAPALQQMTLEFFELLLSLRRIAERDGTVCEALLLGVLTLLEVNLEVERGQRLAENCGVQVVEVREWVEGLFEGAWTAEEGVRALAAGVLVKIQEVAEGWRRALMGGLGIEG